MAVDREQDADQQAREGNSQPDAGRGNPHGSLQRRENTDGDAIRAGAQTSDEEVVRQLHSLDFRIDVNRRYLEKRRRFFDAMGKLLTFVNILGGSAVLSTFFSGNTTYALFAGLAVAIAGLLDLIFRFDSLGQKMHEQYRRHTELQRKIAAVVNATPDQCAEFKATYLEIEADDPAPHQVLMMMCHNEACGARAAYKQMAHIARPRRWMAQVFDLPPAVWRRIKVPPRDQLLVPDEMEQGSNGV